MLLFCFVCLFVCFVTWGFWCLFVCFVCLYVFFVVVFWFLVCLLLYFFMIMSPKILYIQHLMINKSVYSSGVVKKKREK